MRRVLVYVLILGLMFTLYHHGYGDATANQRKLYISTIAVEGLPAATVKTIKNIIEITIFENFKEYRVITDEDVRIMYKKAEALMASGCNAESCQQQIADAIDADDIIYGEIIKKDSEVLFKGKRLIRDKASLQINVGSIVQYSFPEQEINYYIAEIAKKLINPKYTIVKKKVTTEEIIKTLTVEPLKEIKIDTVTFTTDDKTLTAIINALNDMIQQGDDLYKQQRYDDAIQKYVDVMQRIRTKLTAEKQQKLGDLYAQVVKRRDAAYSLKYKTRIESIDTKYKNIKGNDKEFENIVNAYSSIEREITTLHDDVWIDGKKDIRSVLIKRQMALLEKAAEKSFQQYDFNRSYNYIKKAFTMAQTLEGDEYLQYNRYYGNKLISILQTGQNYVSSRVHSFIDMAEYFNVLNDGEKAKRYCDEAYNVITINTQFVTKTLVETYNNAVDVIGGKKIQEKDVSFNGNIGIIVGDNTERYQKNRKTIEGKKVIIEGVFIDGYSIKEGDYIITINGQKILQASDAIEKAGVCPCNVDIILEIEQGNKIIYIIAQKNTLPVKFLVKFLIKPQFDDAGDFYEGIAKLQLYGKYGYINRQGMWIITPQFDDAGDFHEGIAKVKLDDKYGYINRQGTWIIKPQFDDAGDFHEGIAKVEVDGKYGYINRQGMWIIKPQFDNAWDFHEGIAKVQLDYKYGYINRQGMWIIKPQFDFAWDFHEGIAKVQLDDKYGYINRQGTWIIKPQFDLAWDFHEGIAKVKLDDKYGYIDRQGTWIIKPQFDNAGDFHEGIATVKLYRKYGYINRQGTWIIKPQFVFACDFHEGIAKVIVNGKWGYIDRQGLWIIKPQFDDAGDFHEGIATVQLDGKWGYICITHPRLM